MSVIRFKLFVFATNKIFHKLLLTTKRSEALITYENVVIKNIEVNESIFKNVDEQTNDAINVWAVMFRYLIFEIVVGTTKSKKDVRIYILTLKLRACFSEIKAIGIALRST